MLIKTLPDIKELMRELRWLGFTPRQHDALVVLEHHVTGQKTFIWGRNIVTTAGNTWYSQSSCAQTPTNDFDSVYLATAASPDTPTVTANYGNFTVHSGSAKHKSTSYPMCPDTDADNTGDGATIVSWAFSYATGDGPFTAVTHSFIAKTGAGGTDPTLSAYKWAASWAKDASTSAKVFSNHTMLGA